MISKASVKKILGEMPLSAEMYWYLRQGGKPPRTGFKLDQLEERLPVMIAQTQQAAEKASQEKKNIFIFSTLHFWIAHGTMLGLALAGQGHSVSIAYVPYSNSNEQINKFDLRRQDLYTREVLQQASPLIRPISFLQNGRGGRNLPAELKSEIDQVSMRDTQYLLQVEDVPEDSLLLQLRQTRNYAAAEAALTWLQENQPDVVIIPNGSILEFGSVYQVARYCALPTVTYEFGEQRNRLWLAQNQEVMRQPTNDLWSARKGLEVTDTMLEQLGILFSARQKASLWGNFSRQWQGVPSAGGGEVKISLGLDDRPIVLLATNVIGDSLTLGRQIFSDSMTEWLFRTVKFFAQQEAAQLVIRIHPGELVTKGPSVSDIVQNAFPTGLPDHIHLIPADAEINTYDLIEIAGLGLVYTTTTGLEMAMSGIPVIVVGQTHYRNKGFTLDPENWEAFFDLISNFLSQPEKFQLVDSQVKSAWEYAYRFFFEYPHPFPWHLLHMYEDIDEKPIEFILSEEGLAEYGDTLQYLVGEPVDWKN